MYTSFTLANDSSGSIHQFWNDGKHNYNDFTMLDFRKAVEKLSEIVGMDLWSFRVFKMEAGVNIIPPISSKEIILNNFMHKRVEFKWTQHERGRNLLPLSA
jgi:hypothetical protein